MNACQIITVVAGASLLCGCSQNNVPLTSGNTRHGQHLIYVYNCGSCHVIPGVAEAKGTLGPPLGGFGNRLYVAGILANSPGNLVHWVQDPQQVLPGTAMPDMGITPTQASDIAAYLYTLH